MSRYLYLTHPDKTAHVLLVAEGETAARHGYRPKDGWKSVKLERLFDERFESVDARGRVTRNADACDLHDQTLASQAKFAGWTVEQLGSYFEARLSAIENKETN